MQWED